MSVLSKIGVEIGEFILHLISTNILFWLVLLLGFNLYGYQIKKANFYNTSHSLQLDGVLYTPQTQSPKGVVLLIGGSGYSKAGMGGPAKFAKLFQENGFIAFEWNKRGIVSDFEKGGISIDPIMYSSSTMNHLISDAESALDYISGLYPNQKVYIVGGSEGSVVATYLAQNHPNKVEKVSIFGPVLSDFSELLVERIKMGSLDIGWKRWSSKLKGPIKKNEYKKIKWAKKIKSFSELDVNQDLEISKSELLEVFVLHQMFYRPNRDGYWMNKSQLPIGYFDQLKHLDPLADRIEDIKTPLLIQQGEKDTSTPAKFAKSLKRDLKKNNVKNIDLRFYSEAGHSPTMEMFTDALSFFLKLK